MAPNAGVVLDPKSPVPVVGCVEANSELFGCPNAGACANPVVAGLPNVVENGLAVAELLNPKPVPVEVVPKVCLAPPNMLFTRNY